MEQKSIEHSSNDTRIECIICCERQSNVYCIFIKATTNACSHRFCDVCILKWSKVLHFAIQTKRTCPVCRKVYTGVKYTKKIKQTRPIHKHIVQRKTIMLNYGLACHNYVNISDNIVPVFSFVPFMYAIDSYYII